MKWFTSDWHLGHSRIITLADRPFETVLDMNDTIIQNTMDCLARNDQLFIIGDIAWSADLVYEVVSRAHSITKINVNWILGNHDERTIKKLRGANIAMNVYDYKEIKIQGHHTTLCHYPMITWNKSHYNSWMLFGHHHVNGHGSEGLGKRVQGKMLNVNCEYNDYMPWSEDDIVEYMNNAPDNWDLVGE